MTNRMVLASEVSVAAGGSTFNFNVHARVGWHVHVSNPQQQLPYPISLSIDASHILDGKNKGADLSGALLAEETTRRKGKIGLSPSRSYKSW